MDINHYQETKISDFGLVAALLTYGFQEVRTEHNNKQLTFIFDRTPELETFVDSYWAGILHIPALQYCATVESLKSQYPDCE